MAPKRLSRRSFLKLVSLGLAAGGSAWLQACARQNSIPTPVAPIRPESTSTSSPTLTSPTPTSTPSAPTATETQTASPQADTALLVRARHSAAWQGADLDPAALRQMLDACLARLTGLEDAGEAWKSLFKPHERIAIKVNSMVHGCTHPALALAVAGCLQDAGVPAEQITLYDRWSQELLSSRFPVSSSGTGVRCLGTDGQFVDGWSVANVPVRFSQILMDADALINIPVLKAFSVGGLSFAQKNHYGSIDNPGRFHAPNFTAGVTGINALEPVRSRTRLIIGDVLSQDTRQDWTNYVVVGGHEALLMSHDPVALDAVGLQMAIETLEPMGLNLGSVTSQAEGWLQAGEDIGLGVCDLARINIEEINLSS